MVKLERIKWIRSIFSTLLFIVGIHIWIYRKNENNHEFNRWEYEIEIELKINRIN